LRFPIHAAGNHRLPSESLALFRYLADRPAVYTVIHGRVDSSLGLGLYRPETHELGTDEIRIVRHFTADIINAGYKRKAPNRLFVFD
jgi:hypothetical protein